LGVSPIAWRAVTQPPAVVGHPSSAQRYFTLVRGPPSASRAGRDMPPGSPRACSTVTPVPGRMELRAAASAPSRWPPPRPDPSPPPSYCGHHRWRGAGRDSPLVVFRHLLRGAGMRRTRRPQRREEPAFAPSTVAQLRLRRPLRCQWRASSSGPATCASSRGPVSSPTGGAPSGGGRSSTSPPSQDQRNIDPTS